MIFSVLWFLLNQHFYKAQTLQCNIVYCLVFLFMNWLLLFTIVYPFSKFFILDLFAIETRSVCVQSRSTGQTLHVKEVKVGELELNMRVL